MWMVADAAVDGAWHRMHLACKPTTGTQLSVQDACNRGVAVLKRRQCGRSAVQKQYQSNSKQPALRPAVQRPHRGMTHRCLSRRFLNSVYTLLSEQSSCTTYTDGFTNGPRSRYSSMWSGDSCGTAVRWQYNGASSSTISHRYISLLLLERGSVWGT